MFPASKPELRESRLELGYRIDGTPWSLRIVELAGHEGGPTGAFLGGMYGDKALSILALHQLESRLSALPLVGKVILIPAANLPGISVASRFGPDHLMLNRRFPGGDTGTDTDTFAKAIFELLTDGVDYLVDVQSGSPSLAMRYIYTYRDSQAMAAAFGGLPIIQGHFHSGQLSYQASQIGVPSILVEYGGITLRDPSPLVEGCLNVLRYKRQIPGELSGTSSVDLIDQIDVLRNTRAGLLVSEYATEDLGSVVGGEVMAVVKDVSTGEDIESISTRIDGGILLLTATTPSIVTPGSYAFVVGSRRESIDRPRK